MRGRSIVPLLAVLLVVFFPGLAPAAEGGVLAARDMFERALDLGLWTLVVFLLLLFILTRFAWKPILQGLEARERDIASASEDARKAREEALALRGEIAADRQKAAEEIRRQVDEGRQAAQRAAQEEIARGRAEIQTERERLLRDLAVAKDQAMQALYQQTADLAALISSKAIRRHLNHDDHRNLLEEALAEMHAAVDRGRARVTTEAQA